MPDRMSSLVFLQYLTTAFDNIKDAVLLINIEEGDIYRLVLANKVFHHITGFPDEVIGKQLSEFVNPDTYDNLFRRFQKIRATKLPMEYTRWSHLPTGRRAIATKVIPVLNAVDEVSQLTVLAHDVTSTIKLKDEIQKLRAKLAAKG